MTGDEILAAQNYVITPAKVISVSNFITQGILIFFWFTQSFHFPWWITFCDIKVQSAFLDN